MYPTQQQEKLLLKQAAARRWVWNWALAKRKFCYAENGCGIPRSQLSVELTVLKKQSETIWLREVHAAALQQVLIDLDLAYKSFFKRISGFPKFKSRKYSLPTFRIPQNVKVVDNKVCIPKVGLVKIRQSRQIEGKTKSATFKQDSFGNWYVTLIVAFASASNIILLPNIENVVGIDVGLKDFYVLSNGERKAAPKFYRKSQKKLCKAQRILSRRKLDSRRRDKARLRVARIHNRVANQRKDFLHKHSTDLIKRFEFFCIEDLNIKGLARTKLAKSFYDASHGEFRRQLTYKALWNSKHVVTVDRFFPSTKLCSVCGFINDRLTLADRTWACERCETIHDRDYNAACNIKAEGLRLLAVGYTDNSNARGANVRPHVSGAVGAETRIS